ncbi:MAG: hypothetical protein WC640_03290 [Candidatus Paceibacterota bacterium]|jgi:hypothetical protein
MATFSNSDSDKRLRARLALTAEDDVANWKEKEEYLEKRKIEAAKAMASDEQKKAQEEKEKKQLHTEEAQKKLAELETIRRAEEELKNKDLSAKQREKDLAQEKLRQEKIKEILGSQKEIEGIKRAPQSRLSSIHTLTDDLGEAIREKGFTAAKLAGANSRRELREEEKTVSWKKTLILTLSLILFFGGLTAIVWSLWQRTEDSRIPAKLVHDPIIFADEHLAIDLKDKSPEQLIQEIKAAGAKNEASAIAPREKIKDIYFIYQESRNTNEGLTVEQKIASPIVFASSTDLNITNDLLRFLETDFMLGIYSGPQAEPFYIFKTSAYKNSADALLHNENAIVSQLLIPFVDTDTETKIKLTPFQDKMIKNRDVRIVINQDNKTLAVYSWLDKNTIAVTESEFTLEKVLNSFLTPKPVVK